MARKRKDNSDKPPKKPYKLTSTTMTLAERKLFLCHDYIDPPADWQYP